MRYELHVVASISVALFGSKRHVILKWVPTVRANLLPPSSDFHPEYGDRKFLRNIGVYLLTYTMSRPQMTAIL